MKDIICNKEWTAATRCIMIYLKIKGGYKGSYMDLAEIMGLSDVSCKRCIDKLVESGEVSYTYLRHPIYNKKVGIHLKLLKGKAVLAE